MALKGKTIRIKGDDYTVDEQFIDFENHEEVIILKKPTILKVDEPDDALDRPSTIYDLGYMKADDIKYNEELQASKRAELDSKIGHDMMIAMVDPSGLIKPTTVKFMGPLLSSPDFCKLEFEDGVRRMKTDFFITASLLADEYLAELDRYMKNYKDQDSQKKVYDEILDELNDDGMPQELSEIIEIFGDLFTRRFNERK